MKIAEEDNYEKFKLEVSNIANRIIEMENKYDSSMRGHYLEEVVEQYVNVKCNEFSMMYDYIMSNQKEGYDSYGDIDTSVTKIKITNLVSENEEYEMEATGMLLKDIFCSRNFIIIKTISTHKKLASLRIEHIHVRSTELEPKQVSYAKLVKQGDVSRSPGFIITMVKKYLTFDCHGGKIIKNYNNFNNCFEAIIQPYLELTKKDN